MVRSNLGRDSGVVVDQLTGDPGCPRTPTSRGGWLFYPEILTLSQGGAGNCTLGTLCAASNRDQSIIFIEENFL
jgi:hypothetical protein